MKRRGIEASRKLTTNDNMAITTENRDLVINNNMDQHSVENPRDTMSIIHEATHAVAMIPDTTEMKTNVVDVNSLDIKEVKAQTDN